MTSAHAFYKHISILIIKPKNYRCFIACKLFMENSSVETILALTVIFEQSQVELDTLIGDKIYELHPCYSNSRANLKYF